MTQYSYKYVGFYDTDAYIQENRNFFLSATNKMNYIATAITNLGAHVQIISPSGTMNKRGIYKKRTNQLAEGISLTLGFTFGAKNWFTRKLRFLWSWMCLFLYLLFNTKKDENILVYHSLWLMRPVMLAKQIKKFNLILEVEEIYQDVMDYPKRIKHLEYRFFDLADKYIFSTELLNAKLNKKQKPYTVIYGTYQVEPNYNRCFSDSKIHVVYAGIIDAYKGGATAAVSAATYLSQEYHLHIIGFGKEVYVQALKELIAQISAKTECTLTYDGLLRAEEYTYFLQKCHVGLSTQIPDAKYANTSFPSKVLSYLANGLRVVSVRIKAIEDSKIGKLLYFYDKQTGCAIAEAIRTIDFTLPNASRGVISNLNETFVKELRELLE